MSALRIQAAMCLHTLSRDKWHQIALWQRNEAKNMHGEAKYVCCPYYKDNDEFRVKCEGVEPGSSTHVVFGSKDSRHNYQKWFCEDVKRCRGCLIHKMLDGKWGET